LGLPLCLAIPLLNVQPQCAPGSIVVPLGGTAAPASPAAAGPQVASGAAGSGASGPGAKTTSPTIGKAPAKGAPKALGPPAPQLASPLAAITSLLGSGGAAAPQVAGYGLVGTPSSSGGSGALATLSRWAHDALAELW
jgi:hypothetical protein